MNRRSILIDNDDLEPVDMTPPAPASPPPAAMPEPLAGAGVHTDLPEVLFKQRQEAMAASWLKLMEQMPALLPPALYINKQQMNDLVKWDHGECGGITRESVRDAMHLMSGRVQLGSEVSAKLIDKYFQGY